MNEIIRRATVDEIVGRRNRALALYGEAHDAITAAAEAIKRARAAGREASPGTTSFNHLTEKSREYFLDGIKVPEREAFETEARRLTDADVWAAIVTLTDLESLMDAEAKRDLRRQLFEDPPEVTVDNVLATLQQFVAESGTIFRRGIANVFARLDRRFRSHDGFKIGSRVILDRMFDESGWWNYNRNQDDAIRDIERTFFLLDGKRMPPDYAGVIGAIRAARPRSGPQQTEVEADYFRVRVYKNGNAHLWFTRDDLVAEVNRMLAEYYGEVIGDGNPAEEDPLDKRKTTPARHFGFFPTPDAAANRLIGRANLWRPKDAPPLRVLEPSAGTGNLAFKLAGWTAADTRTGEKWRTCRVEAVEIQGEFCRILAGSGLLDRVYCNDFLALQPNPDHQFDRVVMNPPFDRERDIDHVTHALKFLKPDGELHAIMSAGVEFRETKKAKAFRALMERLHARWDDLPPGSFSEVGTNVNTVILRVRPDGHPVRG